MYGIPAPVIVTITDEGISMSVKGAKKHIHGSWLHVASHLNTPDDVPSFLHGHPMLLLGTQADKKGKRRK